MGSTLDFFNTSEENLFTRNSLGGSLFASAPLSEFYRKRPFTQFSRVGLSYQISSVKRQRSEVNAAGESTQFIPVIYRAAEHSDQSRHGYVRLRHSQREHRSDQGSFIISGDWVWPAWAAMFAPISRRWNSPSSIPMRKKRSEYPEVFGFRILAGTVGSFATTAKVRNANSLAFVDGVPIYERFFLGDEFTIRGYNVRSISPVTPLDNFITSRNVVLATNVGGNPSTVPGLPAIFTTIGTFTGATGSNVVALPRAYTATGADTQILGNFEYRIPVIGRTVQAALFVDVGSAFNLRSKT